MTAAIQEALETAVGLLLGVCDGARSTDGAGFNGWDAAFIRDVWPKRPWTPGQAFAIHKLLRKYTKQLAGLGCDFAAIPQPPDPKTGDRRPLDGPTVAQPQGVNITLRQDGGMEITFPYKPETVELVRQIPDRTWDGGRKVWVIKPGPRNVDGVIRFAEQTGAALPPGLLMAHTLAKVELERAAKEAEAAAAGSVAVDADFHVAGLGGVLMPFQRAGVKYAVNARRCLIADEMGLGKTVQALATLKHLDALPALIVCPASLRLNWMREAKKWLPGVVATPYEISWHGDVCVINYDILTKYKDHIMEKGRFKSIVFDEAHYLKNHKAQRSVAANDIAASIRKAKGDEAVVLMLTGTPILNRPGELLHLLQILGRVEDVGGFKTFRDRYMMNDWKGNGYNLEELQQICRSRFLIRREKSQVLTDLPPKRRVTVDINLHNPKAYKAVEDAPLQDNGAAAIVRIGELRREAARQKMPGVVQWVMDFLDTGKKLILFAVHRDVQQELVKTFPGCAQILGEDDAQARQKAVDRFQEDPACQLIVCSLKAAGVGLTLTAASDVAFHEFGWTPGDMDQAEDRAHRIGQRDSVTAYFLRGVEAGIDGQMLQLIEEKREVSRKLLDPTRTAEADQVQVKDRLVKAILDKARSAGRIVRES